MYIHTYTRMYVCMYVHLDIHTCACMHACLCVYTRTFICRCNMHILTDAADVRRCRECDKAICSYCVQMHGRQPETVSHVLTEITSVVREREVLEEKLVSLNRESQVSTEAATIDLQPAVFLGSSVNASNDSSALAHSIGHALCSNGCDGINFDSIANTEDGSCMHCREVSTGMQ